MSAPVVNYDAEKHSHVEHLERTVSDDSEAVNNANIDALTPEEQKKVIRRIDRRLVLTLGGMYCVSLMDRTNTVRCLLPLLRCGCCCSCSCCLLWEL
jgi:hypothetical protein